MARWPFRSTRAPAPSWLQKATVSTDREQLIAEYVQRGSVLDLGVVDDRRSFFQTDGQPQTCAPELHESIRRLNPEVLGVDFDADGIAGLKAKGYNVVCADVETMDLQQRFDAIVGGEIIEHLPNPGRALATLHKHLKPTGRLILTTCNPFDINQFWKIWRYNDVQVHPDHTAWFDPHTLGFLLEMNGFDVERLCWLRKLRRHGRLRVLPARWRSYFCANFLLVARHRPDSA